MHCSGAVLTHAPAARTLAQVEREKAQRSMQHNTRPS